MTISLFERAQVAAFAYSKARHTGALDCMKAVCYVVRNRVKAAWGDGSWQSVLISANDFAGNNLSPQLAENAPKLDVQDRLLQMLVRDIDDIYLGNSNDDTKLVVADALFFQFIDQPPRQWFVENIVRDQANHPRIAQVGPIAFFK